MTAGPSSLPKSLSRTIRRSGLWLPPGARLPFEPLGRRKPAARTLDARPSGRLSLPCPCRHCAALHSAPLRPPALGFGCCRRSWVSGNAHKPLKRFGGHKKWQTKNPTTKFGSVLSRQRFGKTRPGDRTRYNVTFSKSYRDADGQWKTTQSFGRNDLLVLAKVADRAHSRIFELQRTEDESEQAV